MWDPGNYILVRRDDYRPTTPLPPSFPALASHIDVIWDQIPAIGGTFNWSAIEAKVSQIAAQQITLADGRRIQRPVWLTLPVFWRQGEGGVCKYSGPGGYVLAVPTAFAPRDKSCLPSTTPAS